MLWAALERAIPDVRDRAELVLTGTPLTHERYLSRHKVGCHVVPRPAYHGDGLCFSSSLEGGWCCRCDTGQMVEQCVSQLHGLLWQGTYGAAISAASGSFPGPQTPIPQLFRQGPLSLLISLLSVLCDVAFGSLPKLPLLAAVMLPAQAG